MVLPPPSPRPKRLREMTTFIALTGIWYAAKACASLARALDPGCRQSHEWSHFAARAFVAITSFWLLLE